MYFLCVCKLTPVGSVVIHPVCVRFLSCKILLALIILKVELSQDQIKKLFQEAQSGLQETVDGDDDFEDATAADDQEGIEEEDDTTRGGDGGDGDATGDKEEEEGDEDELAKYGLDKYDDDEPMEGMFL